MPLEGASVLAIDRDEHLLRPFGEESRHVTGTTLAVDGGRAFH